MKNAQKMIVFSYDDKEYEIAPDPSVLNYNKIVLPDCRVLKLKMWFHTNPPQPSGLEEIPSLFSLFPQVEVAKLEHALLARNVVKKDDAYHKACQDARDDARYGIYRTQAEVEAEAERYLRQELVTKLASLAHDDWRAPRKIEGSDRYEPRLKKVKDQAWIDRHNGQTEVDIANTSYVELPSEWQAENKASAEIAMDEVLKAAKAGIPLDRAFVEKVADALHVGWVQRNESWAAEELKNPYAELPESEKEKDRYFVRRAIEIYQHVK